MSRSAELDEDGGYVSTVKLRMNEEAWDAEEDDKSEQKDLQKICIASFGFNLRDGT